MPLPAKRPIEGNIISGFDYMAVAQQDSLEDLPDEAAARMHLYMVCTRPRIGVLPDEFSATRDVVHAAFTVQTGEDFRRIDVDVPNLLGKSELAMKSEWPYGEFAVVGTDNERVLGGKSSLLLSQMGYHDDDLDLEVLYVGQSYGVAGSRQASQRLASHETLQAIYAEAVRRSPDREVFLVLLSLADPYGAIVLSPVPADSEEVVESFRRLTTPVTEQQRINFTEAALIKYFSPPYNIAFRNTFPSPAHSTYEECYDLDLNSVAFEMETSEVMRVRLYSSTVKRSWIHMADFPLHDPTQRRSMFDFAPD